MPLSDVQVLKKCVIVLENSDRLKQKWTVNISQALMHMIACITYYLSKVCFACVYLFIRIMPLC